MADKFLVGMDKLLKRVDNINFHTEKKRQFLRKAARPAANVLKDETKRLIPSSTLYPHINHIRRSVKTRVSKSKTRAGVNVVLKGGEVPFGDRFWKLRGYAILTWLGDYKKKGNKRKHKTGKRKGLGQGNVKGTTGYNPFELAKLNKGNKALIIFSKSIRSEITREFNKR